MVSHNSHIDYIHGNYKSCLLGFLCSIILTVIPFFMAIQNFNNKNIFNIITITCAIIQMMVHFSCFFYIQISNIYQWHIISLIFTIMIITILILGSSWIMWHLHYNLMNC